MQYWTFSIVCNDSRSHLPSFFSEFMFNQSIIYILPFYYFNNETASILSQMIRFSKKKYDYALLHPPSPLLECVTTPAPQILHKQAPSFPQYAQIFYNIHNNYKMGSCAPQLINQEIILLEHHHIGDSGMKKILEKHNTRVIKELDVAGNNLTPLTLMAFPKAKWNSLTYLNFNKNKLGDKGCKYLSMATLKRVQRLILSQNNIGNAGVLHLSKAVWKNLKNLSLTFNRIQHQGLQLLSKAKWSNIEKIDAQNNNIDDAFLLTSTIILVSPASQQAITPQKQKGNLTQRNNATLNNEQLLLQLY